MKQLILALTLILSLPACAQPDYAKPSDAQVPSSEAQGNCLIPLATLNVCGSLEWSQAPVSRTYTSFSLSFNDPQISLENLSIVLWMPSMGHGSAPVQIQDLGHGKFEVTQVFFVMAGDWEIRFQIKNNGQIVDSFNLPIFLQ